ncbi:MAG: DUF302 domain-containing protein [Caldilineaceae bacterium]|nr:DUF302 domain-containing protein [Caldilineaceae bacterium]
MAINIGFCRDLSTPYAETVERVLRALHKEGFQVLAEVDIKRALEPALDGGYEHASLLTVANPELARSLLEVDGDLSLMLPCSVVVSANGSSGSRIRITDPIHALGAVAHPRVKPLADELNRRLWRVYLDVVVVAPE